MQVDVKWLDKVCFVGQSDSGHSVVMDGSPEHGGENMGFRPMEMLLVGMGGCASFDVVSMLKKGRQNITDCHVQISAVRADEVPKVFTQIKVLFTVTGGDLNQSAVERAVSLSMEKYCSATLMLAKTAEIDYSIELVSTD